MRAPSIPSPTLRVHVYTSAGRGRGREDNLAELLGRRFLVADKYAKMLQTRRRAGYSESSNLRLLRITRDDGMYARARARGREKVLFSRSRRDNAAQKGSESPR